MEPLEDYQVRVIEEKRSLDEKLGALSSFMLTGTYDSLSSDERRRLSSQHFHMEHYSRILAERIAAF